MDVAIQEFVALIARASSETERVKRASPREGWITAAADRTLRVLGTLQRSAIEGRLPRVSRGQVSPHVGLGLSRGAGEWTQDPALLDAMYAIEDHYRESM